MTQPLLDYVSTRLASTDAEIAAALAAEPPLTVSPIPLDTLGPLLRKVGIMAALKSLVADASTDPAVKAGIADFLDQLADQRQVNLDATDPVIAARSAAVLEGLRPVATAIGVNADALIAGVYALGGGLRYPAATEADVAAARLTLTNRAARKALVDAGTTRWNEFIARVDAWEAAGFPADAVPEGL